MNSSDQKCVLTENKQARRECHIINYLLTYDVKNVHKKVLSLVSSRRFGNNPFISRMFLASSNRTGEYWPSVVLYVTTSGQYSPVRPSRSVSKYGYWPSSFFACLWTETKSRSINSQKKERPTEQTWSIKDLLYGFW